MHLNLTKPLLLAGLLAAAAAAPAAAPREKGEAELQRTLVGMVPGEPVDCVNLRNVRNSRIVDGTAIIYEVGGTLYVNRPRAGRESLDNWDVLVTRTHSSRLCSIDVVQLYDPAARMQTGLVFLGPFVPYRKPRNSD